MSLLINYIMIYREDEKRYFKNPEYITCEFCGVKRNINIIDNPEECNSIECKNSSMKKHLEEKYKKIIKDAHK